MAYHLSLLDKSPILEGETAATALQRTVALAQTAERLGYRRFWVAEHHGMTSLASSAPEILVSHLLARTHHIRIGSGGVLLQHYSPYKVAETFNLLASLAPGRVDLGVGKAPGGLPFSTKALRSAQDPERQKSFEALLAELDGFLDRSPGEDRPLATPTPPSPPERFLLGASPDSARLAASRGWQFVFAGQLNSDPKAIEASFEAYAQAGATSPPLLAVAAFAAATPEDARKLTDHLQVVRLTLDDGQSVNLGSEEQAVEFARQAGAASFHTEIRKPSIIAGIAERVRRELDALHTRFGVTEFVIDTPAAATAQRLASIKLLAGEVPALAA